jgi:hypothetical protein
VSTSSPSLPALPHRALASGVVITACAALAFAPAFGGGFVFDDHLLIEGNPLLGGPLWRVWLGDGAPDFWPLTYSLFWGEWRAFGASPAGYHAVSIALHAMVAVLLWRVLLRLRVPGALLGAIAFAVHPVAVESVAWISEQKNVLSGALFLGAALSYLRHREEGGRGRYVLALLLFLLALLAKTSTVMLPPVLLGIAVVREGRLRRRDLLEIAPLLALSLAFGAVTVWFQWARALAATPTGRGLAERVGGAAWALLSYLRAAFLPVDLAFVSPPWPVSPGEPLFFAPLLVLLLALAAVPRLARGPARPVLLAAGYHALMVLPVLGLVDMAMFLFTPVANHLQYLALMGPAALFGLAAARLRARWPVRGPAAAGLVLAALGASTAARAMAFRDDLALWQAAADAAPQSLMAAWMHAEQVATAGRPREALGIVEAAAARLRDPAERDRARALVLLQRRDVAGALRALDAANAVRLEPVFQYEIAQMLLQAGRPREALRTLAPLLEAAPRSPDYRQLEERARAALGAAGQ